MNLDELIENEENLEKYYEEYKNDKNFLMYYFLQDPTRIEKNYDQCSSVLSTRDKVKLIRVLLIDNTDLKIVNKVIYDATLMSEPEERSLLDGLFENLVDLEKENEINLDDFDYLVKKSISRVDIMYFLKKDIKNFSLVTIISDKNTLMEVLNYLNENNYSFTLENKEFIDDNIINRPDVLPYFINNCSYDDQTKYYIGSKINSDTYSKEQLNTIYNSIGNDYIKNEIKKKLNLNNFDFNTNIKDDKIFLKYDNNYDEIASFLEKAKEEKLDNEIVIIMDRVDTSICDKLHSIYGDKLRISPIENQNSVDNGIWNYEDYSLDHIKKCEAKMDNFVKCTDDTLDKDGDVKSLSPLEKYIAAYMITSKFADYNKEGEKEDTSKSRSIYEIFASDEKPKIVCLGYTHVLRELLYRMGLEDTLEWGLYAPSEGGSYTPGFTNHSRMMIHLQDPKYDIDGVYMADPTWDNGLSSKTYRHMLMSKNEALTVDKQLKPEYLNLDKLFCHSKELNTENVDMLFDRPIPKDSLVKAFLAVNRFLDKNMKMAKSDSEYTKYEYDEISKQLKLEEDYNFDERNLSEMTGEELKIAKDEEVYEFLSTDVRALFKEYLKNNGINIKASIVPQGAFVPLDDTVLLDELIDHGFDIDLEKNRVFLNSYKVNKTFAKKTIDEYFKHSLGRIQEYLNLTNNMSKESEEVKTK